MARASGQCLHCRKEIAAPKRGAVGKYCSDSCRHKALYVSRRNKYECVRCRGVLDRKGSTCTACVVQTNRSGRARNYGVTTQHIETMLLSQGNACRLCGTPITWDTMHIDHDHSCCPIGWRGVRANNKACGKCVRGLLCGTCNVGLGSFKDNSQLLRTAAEYVLKSSAEWA